MRSVQDDDAPVTAEFVDSMETCIQCRACETACPSQVNFGRLMEQTRSTLATEHLSVPGWQRIGLRALAHPRFVRTGSAALALAQRATRLPEALGIRTTLPVRQPPLKASGTDVILFTGCVMDAWQRDIHLATQRVLEAAGFGVAISGDAAPCCGALQVHAGLTEQARCEAERVIAALANKGPILVDSAGCGAQLKDYGHLLGTQQARGFSARVYDVHEWLAQHSDRLPVASKLDLRVAIQDPCHMRHVQRVHDATRTVLRPYVRELVELDDDGMCCGAGGAYSMLQPEIASQVRDRKLDAIASARPDLVASANPGCLMHLAGGETPMAHPMSIIWQALETDRSWRSLADTPPHESDAS
jgi:glycolate oxidase iron-sulfur subunit